MKRTLVKLLQIAASVAILTFLVIQARDSMPDLRGRPPHWGYLSATGALCMLMVVTTIVRWYLLVRALELPFRLRDAFRLGFLGYLFNFVSLGSVGGDLFRAVFVAREQPGRRAEAVATVFIDRLIGLYALFLVASAAVLITGLLHNENQAVRLLARSTLFCTAVSTLGVFFVLTPGFTQGRLSMALARLPYVGATIEQLLSAVRMYRRKLPVVFLAGFLSLGVHSFSTTGLYLAAQGLPGEAPSLASHFLIIPLGMLAAALPITAGGIGAFELVLDDLYMRIPANVMVVPGTGFMVGLVYRVITIVIAIIGFGYYLANRTVVAQIMKQAEKHTMEPDAPRQAAPVGTSQPTAVP